MKTIVVYYSLTGNTAWAAGELARSLDADLLELKPCKAYPDRGVKKFLWGGKSAMMAECPPLEPYVFDAGQYKRVILATPLWAGRVAPPLRTFLREQRSALRGKRFAFVICCGGGKEDKALAQLRALTDAEPDAALCLLDPKDRPSPGNDSRLQEFCRALSPEIQP